MAKTILVPTDFSIDSLNMVKSALEKNAGEPLIIIFAIGVSLPDGITDMLFFSRHKLVHNMVTKEFSEACQIIRKRYGSTISDVRIEAFSGFTQSAFQNFIEGNGIHEVYYPTSPLQILENTFDLIPFIRKVKLPQVEVASKTETASPTPNSIAQLFTNWN